MTPRRHNRRRGSARPTMSWRWGKILAEFSLPAPIPFRVGDWVLLASLDMQEAGKPVKCWHSYERIAAIGNDGTVKVTA